MVCLGVFIWNKASWPKDKIYPSHWTSPLEKRMLIDYPFSQEKMEEFLENRQVATLQQLYSEELEEERSQVEQIPSFQGIAVLVFSNQAQGKSLLAGLSAPLFEKVRQGQIWRLISPCFLHVRWLHLCWNMCLFIPLAWVVEKRIRGRGLLSLIVLLALSANLAQYLVAGPLFVGLSGVVIGLAGFVVGRKEGSYWISKVFLGGLFCIIGLGALVQLGLCLAQLFYGVATGWTTIANTSHLAGGVVGFLLGKSNLWKNQRSLSKVDGKVA
jgi:GlpG protein